MDAGYSVLSSDLEACRMFDQYSYKRNDNLDLSLNVPQHHQTSYHHDSYNMSDQTFHTPSFGDEDFDIPTIHPHSHQQQQQHHQQHDSMQAYQSQIMQGSGMQQSPDGLSLDAGGFQQQLYLQQEHSMQPINVSSAYGNSQGSYATMSSQQQQQPQLQQQQQQLNNISEDNDDSTPYYEMIDMVKREPPSPEADFGADISQRKTKKKKKREEEEEANEPQNPA